MHPRPITCLYLLALAAILGACETAPPRLLVQPTVERVTVPAPLLACEPSPLPPVDDVLAGWTERDWALFTLDLYAAGDDCRSKLGAVRDLVSQP